VHVKPLMKAAMAETRAATGDDGLPAHWETREPDFPSQGWTVVPIKKGSAVFGALRGALETDGSELGLGRDVHESGAYSELCLKRAWRIENPSLWRRYKVERQEISGSIKRHKLKVPTLKVRAALRDELAKLPGELLKEVNETFLLHGTKPDTVLTILQNGPNERFSRGLFGNGTYLAEDAGKCDQYVGRDEGGTLDDELKTLHARLYRKGVKHPGDVYYVFVCRVILGVFVRTKTGGSTAKDLDKNQPVWGTSERRELAAIPDVHPPVHYHGLLVELGESIARYREFVQFHETRLYPEYLLERK